MHAAFEADPRLRLHQRHCWCCRPLVPVPCPQQYCCRAGCRTFVWVGAPIHLKIYVSNLPARTSDSRLAEIFEPFVIVTAAHVMTSIGSGYARGPGFVEMMRESGERAAPEVKVGDQWFELVSLEGIAL